MPSKAPQSHGSRWIITIELVWGGRALPGLGREELRCLWWDCGREGARGGEHVSLVGLESPLPNGNGMLCGNGEGEVSAFLAGLYSVPLSDYSLPPSWNNAKTCMRDSNFRPHPIASQNVT